MLPENFDDLRKVYPKRSGDQGWADAKRQVAKRISEGHDFARILQGAANYAKHCVQRGMIGTEFVKQVATFVGPGCWFDEWADMDMRTPAEIALDAKWQALEARARALGFKEVDRSRGLTTVEYAIRQQEDQRKLRVVG